MSDSQILEVFQKGLIPNKCDEVSASKTPKGSLDSNNLNDLIIAENPNYSHLDVLSTSNFLRRLKLRYPKLRDFKYVSAFYSSDIYMKPFIDYALDNPEEVQDMIMFPDIFYGGGTLNARDLAILNKDFALVKTSFYTGHQENSFLFFNDINLIKEKLFNNENWKMSEGVYELTLENNQYALEKINVNFCESPILPKDISDNLEKDIKCFLSNRTFYEENNLPRKRGLIIHGPPGNGKTSLIKNLIDKYSNTVRVIIDCKLFDQSLPFFLEKALPNSVDKILIFEDLDSISSGDSNNYYKRSSYLNFLDGAKTMTDTLILATTNHPELIDPALIDRPSRFDKIYKIGLPDLECRTQFLLKYFPFLKGDPLKLESMAQKTKGFSGAYFKELFILTGIQQSSLEDAVDSILSQIKMNKNKKYDSSSHAVGLIN